MRINPADSMFEGERQAWGMGRKAGRYILKVGWTQQGREIPRRAALGFLGNQSTV